MRLSISFLAAANNAASHACQQLQAMGAMHNLHLCFRWTMLLQKATM
jgi:hypothetical protein